jgi:Arc/MetJ family transcription regulator
MKIIADIDADLLEEAMRVSGITSESAVVETGLRFLVEREARRRLAALAGTVPDAWAPSRRRAGRRR